MKHKKNLKINISEKKVKDFKSSPVLIRQVHYIKNSLDKLKNVKHTVIIENNNHKYNRK
tara:strand:+ start:1087 stop:1263 length:177 start_codon:yes stop_codon:yes gene_type:complete